MTQPTRRLILGALPALGFAGQALAQKAQPQVGAKASPPPEKDSDYNLDSWVDIYGRPTAKVMLNGMGPFQFMVDTGSTTTVIAARHVATLGATERGDVTVVGTTGQAIMPLVNIASLQTGAVTKVGLDVAVLPDTELVREDGILGGDVFAGRRLQFNIRNKIVRIEPSKRGFHQHYLGNMRVRNGLLAEISGKVGYVPTKLMLDTGAQDCIANMPLSEALLKRHPRLARFEDAEVYGVTGRRIVGQYISLPTVDAHAFSVRDAGCVAVNAPVFDLWGLNDEPAMIVGVSLLARLDSFSIDYGTQMFGVRLVAQLLARNQAAFG